MDEARHERIREIVASIPEGRWCSYGDVAAAAGERSARVVGTVLSTDGADLPWHRVLRTTGTPAPHIAVEQIRRLTAEGVLVVDARAAKGQRWPPAVSTNLPHRTE
ncbi:MAG: methylated-DNA-protein-cysteine methyltransferase related protein [Actinomycetota bacterium]|nr:methylated-DNA-protein-cysteine methyltransferase related protein [Actinomycetota bacterium]